MEKFLIPRTSTIPKSVFDQEYALDNIKEDDLVRIPSADELRKAVHLIWTQESEQASHAHFASSTDQLLFLTGLKR